MSLIYGYVATSLLWGLHSLIIAIKETLEEKKHISLIEKVLGIIGASILVILLSPLTFTSYLIEELANYVDARDGRSK